MYERNTIKLACTSLPKDEHLDGRNMSKKQFDVQVTVHRDKFL